MVAVKKENTRVYFPFPVQYGRFVANSIRKTELLTQAALPKDRQKLLVQYGKHSFWATPYEEKSKLFTENKIKAKARQMCITLDFDYEKDPNDDLMMFRTFEESVKQGVARFEAIYGKKHLLIRSKSGRGFHVIFPLNTSNITWLEQKHFTYLSNWILGAYFFDSKEWICKTQLKNGFPQTQGWYHSQAIVDWMTNGDVYGTTKAAKEGLFFKENLELIFVDLFSDLKKNAGAYVLLNDEKYYYNSKIKWVVEIILKTLDLRQVFQSEANFNARSHKILEILQDNDVTPGMLWDNNNIYHVALRKAFNQNTLAKQKEIQAAKEFAEKQEEDRLALLAKQEQEKKRLELEEIKKTANQLTAMEPTINEPKADIKLADLQEFIDKIFTKHGTFRVKFESKSWEHKNNKQAIKALYEDKENLHDGFTKMITLLVTKCYGKVINGVPVGLGIKQVAEIFNVSHPVATLLRMGIMSYLASGKTDYVKNKLVTKFVIIVDKIKLFFKNKVSAVKRIAKELGNGNTYRIISSYLPALVRDYGVHKAIELFHQALDLSSANDKQRRSREIEKWAYKLGGYQT